MNEADRYEIAKLLQSLDVARMYLDKRQLESFEIEITRKIEVIRTKWSNYINRDKTKSYCEDCKVFTQCPWFCNIEKDEHNNPKEPCSSKEI